MGEEGVVGGCFGVFFVLVCGVGVEGVGFEEEDIWWGGCCCCCCCSIMGLEKVVSYCCVWDVWVDDYCVVLRWEIWGWVVGGW